MITVRECKYAEVKKFRDLEGEYHYMGESHGAGDTIRLVFEEDGKWIALMTWAAACYRLKPHDLKSAHAYATTLADGKFIREIVGLARDVGLRAKSREVDRGGAEGLVQAPSKLMRIMTKGGLL